MSENKMTSGRKYPKQVKQLYGNNQMSIDIENHLIAADGENIPALELHNGSLSYFKVTIKNAKTKENVYACINAEELAGIYLNAVEVSSANKTYRKVKDIEDRLNGKLDRLLHLMDPVEEAADTSFLNVPFSMGTFIGKTIGEKMADIPPHLIAKIDASEADDAMQCYVDKDDTSKLIALVKKLRTGDKPSEKPAVAEQLAWIKSKSAAFQNGQREFIDAAENALVLFVRHLLKYKTGEATKFFKKTSNGVAFVYETENAPAVSPLEIVYKGEFRGGYKSAEGEYANYRDFTISFNSLKGANESPWNFSIENYEGKKSGNTCSDRRNVKSLNINLTDEEFKNLISKMYRELMYFEQMSFDSLFVTSEKISYINYLTKAKGYGEAEAAKMAEKKFGTNADADYPEEP